jgi:hypothetical protein
MMKLPRQSVEIRDFPGLGTAIDPEDLPPGSATIQTNATCEVSGELRVRSGYSVINFEEE